MLSLLVWFAPLAALTGLDADRVLVSAGPEQSGVVYAASGLARELGAELTLSATWAPGARRIRAGLIGDPIVSDVVAADGEALGSEGYAWHAEADGWALVAATPVGLTYGLTELRERVRDGEDLPAEYVSRPVTPLRGDSIDLPMYLGNDLYDGRWRWHKDEEASPTSWFHDRDAWRRRLEQCVDRRMNAIMLCHPHPFPAFIPYPDDPEAAYFDDATLARDQETLNWLVDEGAKYGVGFWFLVWNEWVPRGYAEAKGIPQEGPGTEESAALNRYSYQELFRRFPGLAGLITMAAESPPGCTEFVRRNVVGPLGQIEKPPHIIYWTWCSYPEDVNTVLDGYPGETSIMHYLQYEQLFLPMIDPRVGRMSEACGGRPVVVLGGPGCATGMLYWGAPEVIRDIMDDIPDQHVGGVFFSGLDSWSWVSSKWIGWEALARYWWDPFRDPNAEVDHWRRRIAAVVGHPAFGAPVLRAYNAATDVPMRMLLLTHSQSDVFRPQYGLPLVFYLGMPTVSTYVFENHESIDAQGRLVPRMGLTWPNPDWGVHVTGVTDFVAGKVEPGSATPLDIADGLMEDARQIRMGVDDMRPLGHLCAWPEKDFNNLLGVLTMNELLARHSAAKIRAAVGWERWRSGQAGKEVCLEPLQESANHFRAYAELTTELYPGRWAAKINVLTKRPPWTHLDLWQHYTFVPDYSFLEFADRFAREYDLIVAAMDAGRVELPYALDLVPPVEGEVIARCNTDGPSAGILTNSFDAKANAEQQGSRLVCHFGGARSDFYFPLSSDPAVLPLQRGVRYELVFRYEILRVGADAPLMLSIGARTTEGTWHKDVGARYFSGTAGTTGEIRTQFVPADYDDYYVYVSMSGDGDLAIEDLRLVREAERPVE